MPESPDTMTRRNRSRAHPTARPQETPPPTAPTTNKQRFVQWTKDAVAVLVLLGVLWNLYAEATRAPSVTALNFQTDQPFSLPFSLRAAGFFDMHDVKIDCIVEAVDDANNRYSEGHFRIAGPPLTITASEPVRYICPVDRLIRHAQPLRSASVRIDVSYGTAHIWPRHYVARFAWDRATYQWIEGRQAY